MPLPRWLLPPLVGVAAGTIVLGVGGRIAMRIIALETGAPPGFSLGGSMTVVFLGAVSGLAGGVFYATADRLLPAMFRWREGIRTLLFWVFLVLVTLRGLSPVDAQRVAIFMPLIVVYGVVVELAARRRAARTAAELAPMSSMPERLT